MQVAESVNNTRLKPSVSVDSNDGGQKTVFGNGKTSNNINLLHNPQSFMKRFYQKKLQPLTNNQEEQKSKDPVEEKENNTSDDVPRRVSYPIIKFKTTLESRVDLITSLNEIPIPKVCIIFKKKLVSISFSLLKGILKSSSISYKFSIKNGANNSYSKSIEAKIIHQKSVDIVPFDDNLNSSKLTKHVTFNETVSKKRYRPLGGSFDENTSKNGEQKRWWKQQRKNSDSPKSSECGEDDWCETIEYESIENGD